MKKVIPLIVISALLVSGVAYAGYRYVQAKKTASAPQNGQWQGRGGASGPGRRNAGGMVAGTISAMEAGNLTINLPEGGSKIVLYSDSTKITLYSDAAVSDLAVGGQATVIGTKDSSGAITAQSVQIGSTGGDFMPGRAGGQNGGGAAQAGGGRTGGGNMDFTSGQITAVGDKNITVKASDGTEKNILLSDATKYSKISDQTAADLAVGKIAVVTGTANSDGSVTAASIQIRPELPVISNQNRLQNAAPKNTAPNQNNQGGGSRGNRMFLGD